MTNGGDVEVASGRCSEEEVNTHTRLHHIGLDLLEAWVLGLQQVLAVITIIVGCLVLISRYQPTWPVYGQAGQRADHLATSMLKRR